MKGRQPAADVFRAIKQPHMLRTLLRHILGQHHCSELQLASVECSLGHKVSCRMAYRYTCLDR